VAIDGVPTMIVGVMPARMFAPGAPDVWIPASSSSSLLRNRRAHLFTVIGRLNSQHSIASAQREIDVLTAAIDRDSGSVDPDLTMVATRLQARMVQNARPAILLLWAGVSLVMLIAAANIANLLLMHGIARGRELSIRIALGAGRSRIARQLAIEISVLTCAGGLLGTCLGLWSLPALRAVLPGSIPRASDLSGDPIVVIFGVSVSLLMAAIFGVPFALRSSARQPIDDLRSRTSSGASRSRSRSILVMAEITLTVMLLAGTGLLARSLWAVLRIDPGFNSSGVLTFRVSLPASKYPTAAEHSAFYAAAIERIAGQPGISVTGVTGALPLTGTPATTMEPEASTATDQLSADVITASPGFFTALQIPLRQGRLFAATDVKGAPPVAVVNETAARRFWPDGVNPVGRTMTMKDWGAPYRAEVVGIVGDVHQAGADAEVSPAVYFPFAQFPETTLTQSIVVRTTGDLQRTISAVKEQIWAVDPSQPIASIRTMDAVMAASVAERRFNFVLLTAFGMTALLLSAVGIYGIVAFAVTERTQEIGVRLALGARTRDLVLLVVAHGARPVIAGIAAGLVGAFLASRLLATLLFGVRPTDTVTLMGVAIAIAVVATVACAGPVRRALRTDPIIALRSE
jgi:putative ABC transport system permease protein